MKEMYKERKEVKGLNNLKAEYEKVNSKKMSLEEELSLVNKLLQQQKEDGSWSVIDDYRVDSDIRVEYVYYPTYYATAILMKMDLLIGFKDGSKEKEALCKGLKFAIGRNLMGHGYSATESLLNTLHIYKQAGLYEWMKSNEKQSIEFCEVVKKHLSNFRKSLETGTTYSDWNRDFRNEFEKEVADYDNSFNSYVWYAAYGSNICESRFMRYINRCTDKNKPLESRPYKFMHNIYFASKSRIWGNKGVAFLDFTTSGMALGRVYKIKKTQFDELHEMEGSKYNKILHLGELDGFSVLTFTSSIVRNDIKYPSNSYIDVIKKGLKEMYSNKSEFILNTYLFSRILDENDLIVLKTLRDSAHGISVDSLLDMGISKTKIKKSIEKLYDLNCIKQDSRSINEGTTLTDDKAVIYTNKDFRDLIDNLILISEM